MPTTTPNMNLVQPTVGVDTGLTWENSTNSNAQVIDQHNHTSGNGVQIPPSGININAPLPFNNNTATGLQGTVFQDQTSLATLRAIYTIAGNLYFNDGSSNIIQITAGGTVNATSSGIHSGTATASFSAGVLVVNAASNTPANIQGGSVLLGNNTAGSNFLTLAPPSAMASSFSLTLPSIPASQSFVTLNTSGSFGTPVALSGGITGSNIASATVTRANIVAPGQVVSGSSGVFSTTTNSYVNVTSLSVTITTTGNPVMLMIQSDAQGGSYFLLSANGTTAQTSYLQFTRNASGIAQYALELGANGNSGAIQMQIPANLQFMDIVGAGTYTYTLQAKAGLGATIGVFGGVLVAMELI